MVVGALVGGRAWVRRHEAFGVAFGLIALVSPIDWTGRRPRLRNPLTALGSRTLDERQGAVLAVLVGMALFDAVSYTQWWADFLGVRSLGGYTAFNTLGLAWLVATAAIVWIAVARVAGLVAGQPTALGLRLAAPGAALAAGYATAHEIGSLLNDLRVFALQVTDPLSRGLGPVRDRELAGRDGGVADRPGVALAGAARDGRVHGPRGVPPAGGRPLRTRCRASAPSGSSPSSSSPPPRSASSSWSASDQRCGVRQAVGGDSASVSRWRAGASSEDERPSQNRRGRR